ncbi:MAG: ATP-dependent helicase, partial [Sediminibacterium sp.]|nr:ATP-dependent helicase [Sediminibacterium sp.]
MPDNFNELFENEKARLNPQQAAAVNAIEGPVLVIAGPGTGKTQVLSLRIANILALTDTQPENILCLTYTDNAAYNMRQRLIKIMGSTAYKINVFTFHSLANYIFQENSMFFENKDIPIINKLEEVLFMRELVDDLIKKHRNQHPLTQIKDPYHYIKPLIYLFENIKRENFNPAELINNINHCINDLPNQADFIYKKNSGTNKKGDINYRKLNEATETYKKLEAAISCFELYQNKLKTKARCNFDDLINWVIELLQSHETIRNSYQERFQYILIDEFQDTNGSQYKLMEQLTNFWEKPNLFVVGDDDQSIFRFQGANIENMVHFIQQYITHPPQEVFCLIHNYRSSQQLINSSKTLISNNSERLINNASFNKFELNKDFIAANPLYNQSQLLPIYTLYHTIDDEYIDVVQKIKDLILIDKTPPHEIAVLYKENKIGIELQEYFKVENLPFHCSVDIDILNEPTIKQVIKIFRYVLDETNIKKAFQNDRLLFEILHFRFFNLSLVEIGEVFLQYNQIKNADNNFIHFRYFLM